MSQIQRVSVLESPTKYANLAQRLLRQMARRRMQPGDRLGTELELGRHYGVSRVTVRQALLSLEEDGYISREKARGTFVKKAVQDLPQFSLVHGTLVVAYSNDQASHADEDAAFATVLRAIERTATQRGFALQMLGLGANPESDRARVKELAGRDDLAGICTIGPCIEPYRAILDDLPIVTSCSWQSTPPPNVNPDSTAACRTCIDYLLSHGHCQIALICSDGIGQEAFAVFAKSFEQAYAATGLPCPRHLMCQAYPGESLDKLIKSMLSTPARPTGIFAENWKVCQAVLSAAAALSFRVPQDLSLVAFGRNVLQITYPLAVTAYVPNHEKIGEKAVELFADLLADRKEEKAQHCIPGELIERDSVSTLKR